MPKSYVLRVKTATTHQAKTHLSQLIREVQNGETVTILNGTTPVALLSAVKPGVRSRPPVGTVTSSPVEYDESTFAPLSDEQLKEWGL